MSENSEISLYSKLYDLGAKFLSPVESKALLSNNISERQKIKLLSSAIERETHLHAMTAVEILDKVKEFKRVVGFRPVARNTPQLFNEGCLGKGIDIHAKSSTAKVSGEIGRHALSGMICYQQEFSKLGSAGKYHKIPHFQQDADKRLRKDAIHLKRATSLLLAELNTWKNTRKDINERPPLFETKFDEFDANPSSFSKFVTKNPLVDSTGQQIYGFSKDDIIPYKEDDDIIFATKDSAGNYISKKDKAALDMEAIQARGFRPIALETLDYATKLSLDISKLDLESKERITYEDLLKAQAIKIDGRPLTSDYDLLVIGTPKDVYSSINDADRLTHFGSDPMYEEISHLEAYRGLGNKVELELTHELANIPSVKSFNAISHGPETNNPFPEKLPNLKLGETNVQLDTVSFDKHFKPVMLQSEDLEPYVFFAIFIA